MQKSSIITTIVIILIVAGLYYFFAPTSWKFWKQTAQVIDSTDQSQTSSPHETINAKHQFKNGTHTVAGEANSPTPCDILTTTTEITGPNKDRLTINFVSKTNGEVCAQTITSNRFKVSFNAPENALIGATWNGQSVQLNLIPAGPDEDLSNFELFIKG